MLSLDSGLEFVFLRLEQRDLVRGHDDAHVVDDHALALDGDVAFAGWPRVHNTTQA